MPLTIEQKRSLQAQLDAAKKSVLQIQNTVNPAPLSQPDPTATYAGTNFATSDAAKYGASGKGEYLDPSISGDIQKATEAGVPMAALGDKNKSGKTNIADPSAFTPKPLSVGDSLRYLKSFGLEGILPAGAFAGMTPQEANQRALFERQKRTGQVSANTTFAFNPETLKQTQRAVDKFNFSLDEANKSPFEPKQYKQDNKNTAIDVTSKELGQLFTSPDQLYSAYQFNPQFKATLDKFIQQGGTIEGVAKNITTPSTQNIQDSRSQAVQSLMQQGVTDPAQMLNYLNFDQKGNPTGDFTIDEVKNLMQGKNNQDPATYLASLNNPTANQDAQTKAINELSPETDVAQKEIMRQSQIPSQLQSLYFGDEKTIGILQMKQQQAQEQAKILEQKQNDAQTNARDAAQLEIEKNKAEVASKSATIEQNRLAAKNYITAKLASLGALQTTGAAVLALQTIDTQYQQQATLLQTNMDFANRSIEIKLNDDINNIQTDTEDNILKIQEDLTKSSEDMAKEVLKAQNDAEKQIYTVTEQHAKTLRERTTKYTEDLKTAAEKYAKDYAKAAAGGVDFTSAGNVTSKSKIVSTIESTLESSRGSDGYVNSKTYSDQLKAWIKKGGTTKSFVAAFPPKLYSNPNDSSLPPNLQYARESQTLKTDASGVDTQIQAWLNSQSQ